VLIEHVAQLADRCIQVDREWARLPGEGRQCLADPARRDLDRLVVPELYALGLAAAGRAAEARAVATPLRAIRRDRRWLFLTGIRGLLAIALDDRDRAESAYQALLPYAARPAGADTMLITLWPVALILGDLARHLDLPGAEAHYRHALAIAEQAQAQPWREAAMRRLD
jgi:hypothetical protein